MKSFRKYIYVLLIIVLIAILPGCNRNPIAVNDSKRALITWVDDDGHAGFYTKLKPFVLEYNIPFTSAIITNRELGGRYMTCDQMQELADLGCEFVSHMHTHNKDHRPASMSEKELHYEFSKSKEIIQSMGFNDKAVVYPFGSNNQLVRKIASEYYDMGIDTWDSGESPGCIVNIPFDPYKMKRVSVQGEDVNTIFEKMDEAIKNKSWIILVSHVDQGSWYSDERVRDIIEHALNSGLEFVTLEEGFKQMQSFQD